MKYLLSFFILILLVLLAFFTRQGVNLLSSLKAKFSNSDSLISGDPASTWYEIEISESDPSFSAYQAEGLLHNSDGGVDINGSPISLGAFVLIRNRETGKVLKHSPLKGLVFPVGL